MNKLITVTKSSLFVLAACALLAGCTSEQSSWFDDFQGGNLKSFGQYQDAEKCYSNIISRAPNAQAYFNRAECLYFMKRYDKAIADYDQAIKLNSKVAQYYAERGVAYMQLGDNEKGMLDFTDAIALDPKNGNAYYNRAIAYEKLGKHDLAHKDKEKVAKLGYKPED